MKSWRTLSRRVILDLGRFLQVEDHAVELPNGQVIEDWSWLEMPEYAIIIATTREERFLVFRQVKYAAKGVTLAPPGGYLEPGEDPLLAAQRELLEETGYRAEVWTPLGDYAVDGNRGAGRAHLYLATGAWQVADSDADDLEEQELLLLTRTEVLEALRDEQFQILPWAAAMALALLRT